MIRRFSLVILAAALLLLFHRLWFGEVFFWGLPALQFYPWREFAFDLLRQGQLPLWNPYNGAGAPLFANYQSALLYPFNWFGLFLPLALTMSVTAVLHLFIGGWGMWAFTDRLGFTWLGRGVSALAFGMTSYLVARLGTYPVITAAAWLPWLLWAAHGVVTELRRRDAALLALFTGLLLLAGHAQTAWYSLTLTGLYTVWLAFFSPTRSVLRESVKRIGAVVALMALGAAIAAPQLMATAELLRTSPRSEGVDYDFAMNYSYHPVRALNLIAPNVFGNPGDGSYLTQGAFFEDAVYIGFIPLIGAIASLFGWWGNRRKPDRPGYMRQTVFWWLVVIVAFVFALGQFSPIFPFLYRNVPTFDLFQAPVRWHLWTVTALSILAGIGASTWGRSYRIKAWTRRALAACFAGVALGLIALMALPDDSEGVMVLVRALLSTSVLGVIAALLTLRQPPPESDSRGTWAVIVLVVIAGDLIWASWGLNPTVPATFFEPGNRLNPQTRAYWLQAVEQEVKFEQFFLFDDYRVAGEQWQEVRATPLPNLNLLDRLALLNNFEPLLVGQYKQYIDLIEAAELPQPALQAAGVNSVLPEDGTMFPAARAWFVGAICWREDLDVLAQDIVNPDWNPVRIAYIPGDGGCPETLPDEAQARVVILEDRANSVIIETEGEAESWLILADTQYPGWTASVDGVETPIYPANLAFRAVQVPAGAHTVRFDYHPFWILPGVIISVLGLLLTLLLFRLKDPSATL